MTDPALRPLGHIETGMSCMHELRGTTQTTSVLTLHGPLDVPLLHAAAALLREKHALLRAVIHEQDERLCFFACDEDTATPIRNVHLSGPNDWHGALEDELDTPLDATRSLWKLALLHDADGVTHHVALTCHHAIVDAVSLAMLLGELLRFCDDLLIGPVGPVEADAAPPPVDAFLGPPLDDAPASSPPAPSYACAVPLSQRRAAVLVDAFDGAQLRQLLQAAQRERLTLNALLGGALSRAACVAGLGDRMRLNTAVSLRDRAARKIPADLIGCYIGVASSDLTIFGRPLTELARDYQRQLQRRLARADRAPLAPGLADVRRRCAQLREARSFVQGIALTNHGRLRFPRYRAFELQRYLNVANRVAGNFAVALHVATLDDTLTMGFTFVVPLIERERIETLRRHMRDELLAFGHTAEAICHED